MDEPLSISPLWLEYSGLPQWLNANIRAGAWSVFKNIVELDCRMNAIPDIVEIAPAAIAEHVGLDADVVMKTLLKLRQKRIVAASLADSPEEESLLQIQIPLKTPIAAHEICKQGGPFFRPGMRLRYAYPIEEPPGDEVRLQQVVDLYFNNISMRMNSFVLDELRLVARRFSLESVRAVFGRAGLNDVHELGWAVRELIKTNARKNQPEQE